MHTGIVHETVLAIVNLFIDTLATRIEAVPRAVAAHPANIFADDVLLLARDLSGLQILLDICTAWADRNNM